MTEKSLKLTHVDLTAEVIQDFKSLFVPVFVTVGQLRATSQSAMIKQVRMVNNVFDLLDHLSFPA